MADMKIEILEQFRKTFEHSSPDLLKTACLELLKQVMEAEVAEKIGVPKHAKSPARNTRRNGYRARPYETRLGSLELQIPKLRTGSYMPAFLEPRRRWERAFVNVVAEAYIQGVSTRKVEGLLESMGAMGMSKSQVSRMAQSLDEEVSKFRNRQLYDEYPYLWLDALYVKVRENGRVASLATFIAYGVSSAGQREILGVQVAEGEMTDAWEKFLFSLVSRGLRGIQLVISDSHSGLKAAIARVFNGASWQRCRVHFMRNVMSRVRHKKKQAQVLLLIKQIFAESNFSDALKKLKAIADQLEAEHPEVAKQLTDAEAEILTYMDFPSAHWRKIHSTNPIERTNKEIRRRTDVVGIFPNRAAAIRLMTMILIEQNEEWSLEGDYLRFETMGPREGAGPLSGTLY